MVIGEFVGSSMTSPYYVPATGLTNAAAEARVQELARSTERVRLSRHAKDRMEEREISMTEVYRVLQRGTVTDSPTRSPRGDWKFKMTFRLRGRRVAGIALALDGGCESVTVVTVEWEDGL